VKDDLVDQLSKMTVQNQLHHLANSDVAGRFSKGQVQRLIHVNAEREKANLQATNVRNERRMQAIVQNADGTMHGVTLKEVSELLCLALKQIPKSKSSVIEGWLKNMQMSPALRTFVIICTGPQKVSGYLKSSLTKAVGQLIIDKNPVLDSIFLRTADPFFQRVNTRQEPVVRSTMFQSQLTKHRILTYNQIGIREADYLKNRNPLANKAQHTILHDVNVDPVDN
jgi:hypothetical protein